MNSFFLNQKLRMVVGIAGILTQVSLMTGCLKTRAQLRDDQPVTVGPAKEVNVPVSDAYVLDEVRSEITRMTGRIEDLERANEKHAARNSEAEAEKFKKWEERLTELEQNQIKIQEALQQLQENPKLVDPEETLSKAKSSFKKKDYEEAIEQATLYLKLPKVKKGEEAVFLKGESYFHLKEYKKAIVEYSRFPEKYAQSKKMPEVLLRIGQSFDALGMKEDAKGFYQELTHKYPHSQEAKKVKKPSSRKKTEGV